MTAYDVFLPPSGEQAVGFGLSWLFEGGDGGGDDGMGGSDLPSWSTLGPLVKVTFSAILEVFILCLAGFYMAKRGTLDGTTTKKLSKINVNLFTPALIFSKVAASLTPNKLQELAIVPILFVIITFTSAMVGLFTAKVLFRLPKSKTGFVIACAMFQNSNSLPVALIQSLIVTVPQLKWGERDTKDRMLARGLTYLMLYSVFGMILRWSYGVRLLAMSGADPEAEEAEEANGERGVEDEQHGEGERVPSPATLVAESSEQGQRPAIHAEPDTVLLSPEDVTTIKQVLSTSNSIPTITTRHATEPHISLDGGGPMSSNPEQFLSQDFHIGNSKVAPRRIIIARSQSDAAALRRKLGHSAFQSFPSSPVASRPASEANEEDSSSVSELELEIGQATWRGRIRSLWRKTKRARRLFHNYVGKPVQSVVNFMTPPLWASLASIVVALVPGVQRAFDQATPLRSAINNAGACSIPITLVVLGAYFVSTAPAVENPQTPAKPIVEGREESLAPSPLGQNERFDEENGRGRHAPQGDERRSSSAFSLYDRIKSPFTSTKSRSASGTARAQLPSHDKGLSTLRPRGMTEESRTILAAVLARMIFAPLILYPLFAWYAIATTENVADDPVFILAAVLLIGGPSAITLAQITQAASPSFELLISRVMFHSYAVATTPLTILGVIVGLVIAGLD